MFIQLLNILICNALSLFFQRTLLVSVLWEPTLLCATSAYVTWNLLGAEWCSWHESWYPGCEGTQKGALQKRFSLRRFQAGPGDFMFLTWLVAPPTWGISISYRGFSLDFLPRRMDWISSSCPRPVSGRHAPQACVFLCRLGAAHLWSPGSLVEVHP